MYLNEVVSANAPDLAPLREAHEGFVASDPDADGRVLVVVPAFDPDRPLGPCVVMPRGTTTASRGDRCAVLATAEGSFWVLGWEPA